jgi:lipopolysaccharide/colanic/teichoic acid biosynthesis glycosyltransferase
MFSPSCPIPQDPPAYDVELSLWSLSLAKRCVDLLLVSVALLLVWPLLLVAALLVRYKSPGPVIFRQKRVGRHGVLFTVFKFRTMAIAGQEEGPSLTKSGGSAGDKNWELPAQV